MNATHTTTILKKHDIVRIGNGDMLIITEVNPHKPANKYSGVLVNGQGKQYAFGARHRPVYEGHAEPNHPALMAHAARNKARGITKPAESAPVCAALVALDRAFSAALAAGTVDGQTISTFRGLLDTAIALVR